MDCPTYKGLEFMMYRKYFIYTALIFAIITISFIQPLLVAGFNKQYEQEQTGIDLGKIIIRSAGNLTLCLNPDKIYYIKEPIITSRLENLIIIGNGAKIILLENENNRIRSMLSINDADQVLFKNITFITYSDSNYPFTIIFNNDKKVILENINITSKQNSLTRTLEIHINTTYFKNINITGTNATLIIRGSSTHIFLKNLERNNNFNIIFLIYHTRNIYLTRTYLNYLYIRPDPLSSVFISNTRIIELNIPLCSMSNISIINSYVKVAYIRGNCINSTLLIRYSRLNNLMAIDIHVKILRTIINITGFYHCISEYIAGLKTEYLSFADSYVYVDNSSIDNIEISGSGFILINNTYIMNRNVQRSPLITITNNYKNYYPGNITLLIINSKLKTYSSDRAPIINIYGLKNNGQHRTMVKLCIINSTISSNNGSKYILLYQNGYYEENHAKPYVENTFINDSISGVFLLLHSAYINSKTLLIGNNISLNGKNLADLRSCITNITMIYNNIFLHNPILSPTTFIIDNHTKLYMYMYLNNFYFASNVSFINNLNKNIKIINTTRSTTTYMYNGEIHQSIIGNYYSWLKPIDKNKDGINDDTVSSINPYRYALVEPVENYIIINGLSYIWKPGQGQILPSLGRLKPLEIFTAINGIRKINNTSIKLDLAPGKILAYPLKPGANGTIVFTFMTWNKSIHKIMTKLSIDSIGPIIKPEIKITKMWREISGRTEYLLYIFVKYSIKSRIGILRVITELVVNGKHYIDIIKTLTTPVYSNETLYTVTVPENHTKLAITILISATDEYLITHTQTIKQIVKLHREKTSSNTKTITSIEHTTTFNSSSTTQTTIHSTITTIKKTSLSITTPKNTTMQKLTKHSSTHYSTRPASERTTIPSNNPYSQNERFKTTRCSGLSNGSVIISKSSHGEQPIGYIEVEINLSLSQLMTILVLLFIIPIAWFIIFRIGRKI